MVSLEFNHGDTETHREGTDKRATTDCTDTKLPLRNEGKAPQKMRQPVGVRRLDE